MDNKKAAKFLENYNKWRRGDDSVDMPNQKELGEVIDFVVKYLRETKHGCDKI